MADLEEDAKLAALASLGLPGDEEAEEELEEEADGSVNPPAITIVIGGGK